MIQNLPGGRLTGRASAMLCLAYTNQKLQPAGQKLSACGAEPRGCTITARRAGEAHTLFKKIFVRQLRRAVIFLQMAFDYTSRKWKTKRLQILRRDKYQCQDCRRYGRIREAAEVHHIKHADEYPELVWDSSNLVSLCHACHNARHPEKAKAARERRERK